MAPVPSLSAAVAGDSNCSSSSSTSTHISIHNSSSDSAPAKSRSKPHSKRHRRNKLLMRVACSAGVLLFVMLVSSFTSSKSSTAHLRSQPTSPVPVDEFAELTHSRHLSSVNGSACTNDHKTGGATSLVGLMAGHVCCEPEPGEVPKGTCCASFDGWGGVIVYFLVVVYTFLGLAIICDDYFCESLEQISEALKLSDDVAGATFMAAGSSAPELFTAVVTILITGGSEGLGTIVGSAVFNIMIIVGVTCIFAGQTLAIWWYPLSRDCAVYVVSIGMLLWVVWDKQIDWWEGVALMCGYGVYIVLMVKNEAIVNFIESHSAKVEPTKAVQAAVGESVRNDQFARMAKQGASKTETTDADIAAAAAALARASMSMQIKHTHGTDDAAAAAKPDTGSGSGAGTGAGTGAGAAAAAAAAVDSEPAGTAVQAFTDNSDGKDAAVAPAPSDGSAAATAAAAITAAGAAAASPAPAPAAASPWGVKKVTPAGTGSGGGAGAGGGGGGLAALLGGGAKKATPTPLPASKPHKRGMNPMLKPSNRTSADASLAKARAKKRAQQSLGTLMQVNSAKNLFMKRIKARRAAAAAAAAAAGGGTGTAAGAAAGAAKAKPSLAGMFGSAGSLPAVQGSPASTGSSKSLLDRMEKASESKKEEDKSSGGDGDEEEEGIADKILHIMSLPYLFVFRFTVPDCREDRWAKWYMLTFTMSIVWIGILSFVMVDFASRAGCVLGVPGIVMGLIVIAAGTSVPDALSSVLVAKNGQGDMAVANVLGSNIFNIFLGLGFPWLMKILSDGGNPVYMNPNESIILPTVILVLYLLLFLGVIVGAGWKLSPKVGYVFFCLHALFVAWSMLTMLDPPVISINL